MPLISVETNQKLPDDALKALSKAVADTLGKPESYVMLKYQHNPDMLFAGTTQPLAYLQLKSLGFPESRTKEFSSVLTQALQEHASIPADRVYIEFSNPERHMWGWNNSTF